jgi:predicted nucleotidyltransferase
MRPRPDGQGALTDKADIGLPAEWRAGVVAWAQKNDSVQELWLFGSRAKGEARDISDVDLGMLLMPARGKHDWALGNYVALAG